MNSIVNLSSIFAIVDGTLERLQNFTKAINNGVLVLVFANDPTLWSTYSKAHLSRGREYSYLGHDRNTPGGSEMLANLYLEYIEEIGTSRSA